MARALLANNAVTTLSAAIVSTAALTFNVTSGASFPVPAAAQYFWATLLDSANVPEIVKVTGNAANVFTVLRGQDGTAARAFNNGAAVEMRITAALIAELAALTDGMPVGTVFYRASNNVPAGALLCDGSAVSRTTYAALFTEIGTTYGVGDGSTTYNLPQLGGEFIRVLDNGRGVDASRALGSGQGEAFRTHAHSTNDINSGNVNFGNDGTGLPRNASVGGGTDAGQLTGSAGGAETRPRNVAMPAFIKY